MRWSMFSFETVFKRIFRYLLKRYLGLYFEDFSLDELTCGLSRGKGSVENVKFNIEALNELSEEYNLPVQFLSGTIDNVSFLVPYAALLAENIVIELKGVRLIVQPKERPEDVSMFDSMWGSMTSSLQLAEECMNSKSDVDDEEIDLTDKSEGLERIAKTIDTVLANMKIRFHDFSLKLEHVPRNGSPGVTLEMKIATAEYFDEAGVNTPTCDNQSGSGESSTFEPQAYSFKKVIFEGVSLFTAHLTTGSRTAPTRPVFTGGCLDPSTFVPGSPEMPPTHPSLPSLTRNEPDISDDPVLISRLSGQQELRLKLKQNEGIIGPKVDVEFNLGGFNLFLIPKQVHMLYQLLSGLMKPNSTTNNRENCPLSVTNKPLRPVDYALVEQELLKQKSESSSKSLKNQKGWSSPSLEESDEDFQLMATENRGPSDFYTSPLNDSMCSSTCSDNKSVSSGFSGPSRRNSRTRSSTVQAMLQDQLSELTHFRGCCSSLCIIVLHDDSVEESFSRGLQDASNSNKQLSLKERAEAFFDDLLMLQMSGCDFRNFKAMRGPLSKLCETNHLRLTASSISLDGNEKSSSAQYIINFSLTLYKFEILECLFNSASSKEKLCDPTYMEILVGDNTSYADDGAELNEASFKMKYQQIEYTTQSRIIKPPANKLDIHLGSVTCELDISLTDRIQTLLNFQKFFGAADFKNDYKDDVVTVSRCSSKTEVNISSPNIIVYLRFPIPDLRSIHDMDRVPWWQQNLHKEILIMELKDATFSTTLDSDEEQAKFIIQCRDFHGLLKMSPEEDPISFVRVSVDPDVKEDYRDGGFDWPRLVINQTAKTTFCDLVTGPEEEEEDLVSCSMTYVLMAQMDSEPTPFSSTPIAYGSKLQNLNGSPKKEENSRPSIDHDEVVKPADKDTILHFIDQTMDKSDYLLQFTLPTVNMVLPSKDFFSMLYNRLFSDLLLWQKTSFAPTNSYDPNGLKIHVPGLDFSSHMSKDPVFKPFPNDTNSDPEDEDTPFFSVYEYCQRQKEKYKKKDSSNALTKMCLSLAITKGMLSIITPAVDDKNEEIPDQCGQMQLRIEDGSVFLASSYKGNDMESYMCFLAEKSTLFHNGSSPLPINVPIVQPLSNRIRSSLNCIVYESEPGMSLKSSACDGRKYSDMLKVAVHVVNNPKQLLKSFKVAVEISNGTLRHYTHPVSQMWINQFIDFLKVKDFPVNGYIPSAAVTEFHLNLSNCAIDYRPLKLPVQAAVTLENFNMSCNISATTKSFLFRTISEELRIFLTNNVTAKKIELSKNYVCVIDTGLIDISFRTSVDERNEPTLELCATNNIIHLRTCADSFKALVELITYMSCNGDVESNLEEPEETIEIQSPISPMNDAEAANLNLLMAEAMKECSMDHEEDQDLNDLDNRGADENVFNTDDEFCILEDDPGLGIIPRNGEPQIRMLTDTPIEIIENHFSVPPGKSDVLKAPKHYPKPMVVLALREMSLVWHLYGGSDFKANSGKKKKNSRNRNDSSKGENNVHFSDEKNLGMDVDKNTVTFCNVTPLTKEFDINAVQYTMEHVTIHSKKDSDAQSWINKGGHNRNHSVLMELQLNKVQFQREVYPGDNEYASRYILLIHDIEIRDRLKSSEINKFLYQYSSKSIPRQSHANMIDVKGVYTRPDPKQPSEECSLRVSCKPLRLNIDQDSLMFLIEFFQEAVGVDSDGSSEESDAAPVVLGSSPTVLPSPRRNSNARQDSSKVNETFYRFFSFSPDVLIRIDYQGKRVLMEQGALYGLLMGLGQLNSSEIRLKRICYRHGLLGHHKVLSHALSEWQQDILKNQLPSLLGGVGPIYSFVQLFQGIKDLFYMPIAQYKKDGQIVRGLQRGASSFSTSTAMAVLDLASRLIRAIQGAAIVGCDMVSPGPSVACKFPLTTESHRQTSQPADIREGIATAYSVVKEGLSDTARAIYCVAHTEHEHKGVPGAVGGVLRQIPPSLFKPIILGSEATNHVLGGMRHQLMPDAHQEDLHKWRTKNS